MKQLGRLTLSAALSLGLIGMTGGAWEAWAAVNSASNSSQNMTKSNGTQNMQRYSAHTITDVQRMLRRSGYYNGRVDGVYGAQTRAAVEHFQRHHGLAATGYLNRRTLATLGVSSMGTASRAEGWNESNTGANNGSSAANGYENGYGLGNTGTRTNGMNSMYSGNGNGQSWNNNGNPNGNFANGNNNLGNNAYGQANRTFTESAATVRQVQSELEQQGFYSGAVNGRMGPLTRQAIRSYQRAHNLSANGRLDQPTLNTLGVD